MLNEILHAFKELAPCGLRPVVEALEFDHKDVKEAAEKLMEKGLLKKYNNGQYLMTDAGLDAVKKWLHDKQPEQEKNNISADDPLRKDPLSDLAMADNTAGKKPESKAPKAAAPNLAVSLDHMSTDELIQLAYDANDFLLEIRRLVRERVAGVIGLTE